jgi:alanine racemase
MRPTYAEIDLGAIRSNVTALAALIAPSEICAVVKADAYGHGDVPVAEAAIDGGATLLAVALVEEGVRLREAGIEAPILVLSEPDAASMAGIAKWALTPTVYSISCIEALASVASGIGVHVKLDTGMHRVGASPRLLHDLVATARSGGLVVAAIWTHFPVADEDAAFTRHQIEVFDEASSGYDTPLTHLANTAGALLFPESRRSFARIGLGIYGLHPCAATREFVRLRPAMRIVTHVSHVQRLERGARPSYGRTRQLSKESTVVTAPIGYADGLPRRLSAVGAALIGGNPYPLAGTVTMDQIVIDVGDAEVHPGDEVIVLGDQGNSEVSADDWARFLDTISYEVVCGIGPRVPRRYLA